MNPKASSLSFLFCLAQTCALLQAAPQQPNIVFCMTDDQGFGDVGYNGHPVLQTPHLDQMAQEGLLMENFFSGAPVCSPTRATTLTGRHHYRCGVKDHSKPINPDEITVADALRAHGYRTGFFGKWHLGDVHAGSASSPHQLGFDTYFATPNNDRKVDPEDYFLNGKAMGVIPGEDSRIIMDRSLDFMRHSVAHRQPFLAFVWFHTPHTPHGSTDEFLSRYEGMGLTSQQIRYYACLTAMDEQMGRLRAALREMEIAEDTLLVFCSDNGAIYPGSNDPWRGQKASLSHGGLHVPGLVEWPSVLPAPASVTAPMVTTDLYATFLAAAGIDSFGPARDLDSENLLPVLKGEKATREQLVRFYFRGGKRVLHPDATLTRSLDPGYDSWLTDILDQHQASLAVVADQQANIHPQPVIPRLHVVSDEDGDGHESVLLSSALSVDPDGTVAHTRWSWPRGSAEGMEAALELPQGVTPVQVRITDDKGLVSDRTIFVWVRGKRDGCLVHKESAGFVVAEAEDASWFHARRSPVAWKREGALEGFAGKGYLMTPDRDLPINSSGESGGASAFFPFTVATAGNYAVWIRRYAPDHKANAVHVALNGESVLQNADNEDSGFASWQWVNPGSLSLDPGTHVLELIHAEDGMAVDRWILTADTGFRPSADGPPASAMEGVTSFASFMQHHSDLEGPEAMPSADPDRDGIENLLEFAFNGSVSAGSPIADFPLVLHALAHAPEPTFAITYRRRRHGEEQPDGQYHVQGISYQWQRAGADGDWSALTGSASVSLSAGVPEVVSAEMEKTTLRIVPDSPGEPLLLRLRISPEE